jgi:hypothetical protein
MYKIKLKKRQTFNHNGTMTIDVNFDNGEEAFNKPFVFPIDMTADEVNIEIKSWLEEKEECDKCLFDPNTSVDTSKIKSGRKERKTYQRAKDELREMVQLISLGAMAEDDVEVIKLRNKVKELYKPEYARKK